MNNQTAQTVPPPDDGKGKKEQLSFTMQTREELTAHQVSILINIVHTMRSVAFIAPLEEGSVPKECQVAAENTLVQTCERLQSIVEDNKRWALDQHREAHSAIIAAHKKQEQLVQANLELIEMHKWPSVILKPTVATYMRQYFIAFFGKLEEPGMAIIGRGNTPAEALADFDAAFNRTPAQQFRIISDMVDSTEQPKQSETPEEFKKNNPPNEQ